MITLITGLPGNGKTLFSLWYIKKKAEAENREVYYHNIKDLTLPWTVCEPEKWMDLPHGSIIVLDECQFVFPKKPNGAKLPDYYEQLATHRHKGFDIFLITQHPTLVDNFVRQLAGQHFHAVRKFGLNRATIYEWSAVNPGPQLASSQKSAIPLKWSYPQEVYGYYKSAEVHTVKRSIPAKLILAVVFVLSVPVVGYYALDKFQQRGKVEPSTVPVVAGQGVVSSSTSPGAAGPVPFDPVADARNYVAMNTPRVVGLPQTAPKYDELTKPTRVPVPAACVQIGSVSSRKPVRCKCYSQQGTPLDVEFNMCISFARNGWFRDFEAEPNRAAQVQQQPLTAQSVPVSVDRTERPSMVSQGSSVVMFAGEPESPRPVRQQEEEQVPQQRIPARTVYKAQM